MEQWLYDRMSENLIVVILAAFSGFEIVRRLLQTIWTTAQTLPYEAVVETIAEFGRRSALSFGQLFLSVIATQSAVGRFAKEQVPAWPEGYHSGALSTDLTANLPLDIELDRKSETKIELASAPVQLRLCGGECSGL